MAGAVAVDGGVQVHVDDAGDGVPDRFVDDLFERFSQASVGDRRTARGVGLGLSIVRALVEANGGTVAYRSSPMGGARFLMRLPVRGPLSGELNQTTVRTGALPHLLLHPEDDEEVTMARFQIREGEHPVSGEPRYRVVDTDNDDLPVARFDSRAAAEAHAQRLEEGPFDWDEQEAWQDDWDDDDWGDGDAETEEGEGGS